MHVVLIVEMRAVLNTILYYHQYWRRQHRNCYSYQRYSTLSPRRVSSMYLPVPPPINSSYSQADTPRSDSNLPTGALLYLSKAG